MGYKLPGVLRDFLRDPKVGFYTDQNTDHLPGRYTVLVTLSSPITTRVACVKRARVHVQLSLS